MTFPQQNGTANQPLYVERIANHLTGLYSLLQGQPLPTHVTDECVDGSTSVLRTVHYTCHHRLEQTRVTNPESMSSYVVWGGTTAFPTSDDGSQVEDMMVQINADKEEAEVVRVKVEAEEATANEKVGAPPNSCGRPGPGQSKIVLSNNQLATTRDGGIPLPCRSYP